VSEKKEMFGKSIIFSIIPETQALMGFLIAVLLMIGSGLMGATDLVITSPMGLVAIAAGLAVGLAAVSAVGQGYAVSAGISAVLQNAKMFGKSLLFSVLPQTQALYGFLIAILLLVGGGLIGAAKTDIGMPIGLVAIAAAFSVGFGAVSAVGQGIAAASGIATITEKPKMFGKSVLFAVLPETQALYGFLIAVLLLAGAGLIGAVKIGVTTPMGIIAVGAGLAAGIAAVSAIGQGVSAASGIAAATERKEMFGKSIIFSIIPETQALMGFLIAVLLLIGSGLMGGAKLALTTPMGFVAIGAGLAVGLAAVSAVGQGYAVSAGIAAVLRNSKMFGKSLLFSVLPQTQALYGFLIAILLLVGGGLIGTAKVGLTVPAGLIAVGAGLAVGLGAISAIGQGIAASSGVGATSENSKMFGKSILFSVLPETQALYGIIIAILLLTGAGLLGAAKSGITLMQGLGGVGAGLVIGFAAVSAIGQGVVSAMSIGASVRNPKSTGKGLVLSVIPETYAIFGLLTAILIMLGLKIL
jgi:V/A-type H+-transporting ATPase subunit K